MSKNIQGFLGISIEEKIKQQKIFLMFLNHHKNRILHFKNS